MNTTHARVLCRLAFTFAAIVATTTHVHAQGLAQRETTASVALRGATMDEIDHVAFSPSELKWWDAAGLPGAEIAYLVADGTGRNPYAFRLRFPDGYEMKPHKHGSRRFVTVLHGTYHIGFGTTADRARTVAFPAGSFIMLPGDMPHFGWVEGETILQMSGRGPFEVRWADGN